MADQNERAGLTGGTPIDRSLKHAVSSSMETPAGKTAAYVATSDAFGVTAGDRARRRRAAKLTVTSDEGLLPCDRNGEPIDVALAGYAPYTVTPLGIVRRRTTETNESFGLRRPNSDRSSSYFTFGPNRGHGLAAAVFGEPLFLEIPESKPE